MQKNASRVQWRKSQALTKSTPPPTQPPCTAAITGIRARSSALKLS